MVFEKMRNEINIYCDESCHLENDRQNAMVIGAIWCQKDKARKIATDLREIKKRHGLSPHFEMKWGKITPSKTHFYLDMVEYFFVTQDLHFRALVVPDKTILQHEKFNQTHDTWYYKMYFEMLKWILSPDGEYYIYLDVKDTCSSEKVKKLHEVIGNSIYDFDRKIVKVIQTARSHEIEQIQLADLMIGAMSYVHRGLDKSSAKLSIIERIRQKSGYSLTRTTLIRESKLNILIWRPEGDIDVR